jgi:hypothetical protein
MLAAVWSRGRESTAIPHSLVLLTLPVDWSHHARNGTYTAQRQRSACS